MNVSAVRKRVGERSPSGLATVLPAERLQEGLAHADAVILAAPHTHATKHMIGEAEIASMKRGSVLINVSRGKLIDDRALAAALVDGHLGGAALDAFEREPLPADHIFWDLPNLLVTPHTAAFGQDYWRPAVDLFVENLRRFRSGEPLTNVVDKRRGY
jgi:phosphoglycerate dehydrogenase-like enzyme